MLELDLLEPVEQVRVKDHVRSGEGTIAQRGNERQDIVDLAGLDAVGWALAAEQPMGREQPQTSLVRGVELRELIEQPLQGEQPL